MHDLSADPRDEVIHRLKQAVESLLKYAPDNEEGNKRKTNAEYTLSDAMVQDASERFIELKESARQVHYRSLLQSTASKMTRIITGALKSTIDAHGPIHPNLMPSATRRISHQLAASMIVKISGETNG